MKLSKWSALTRHLALIFCRFLRTTLTPLSAKLWICGARTAGLQHTQSENSLGLWQLGKKKTFEKTFYHPSVMFFINPFV